MDQDLPIETLERLQAEAEEEELQICASVYAVFLIGTEMARLDGITRRNPFRLYLRRTNIIRNPRVGTPWQILYESSDDRAFKTTMAFHQLLDQGFRVQWESNTIKRQDVSRLGKPQIGGRSLDAAGALGLILHYLNSLMLEKSLQQIFALIPSTVSRYLCFGLPLLLETTKEIPEGDIRFPTEQNEYETYEKLIVERHHLLIGAFGSVDGLSLPVQESDDPTLENATYSGWKKGHFVNNILVFSPEGIILHVDINAPGSWHDANVAKNTYKLLRQSAPPGYYLIADSAFLRLDVALEGRIKVPLKGGDFVPGSAWERSEIFAFNRQLLSFRQTAEWGMRTLQGSFGRLRVPLDIGDPRWRRTVIEMCCRLFNIRACCVGVGQIRNVYMPLWKDTDDSRLWTELHKMMFKDIRRGDRVSRYHLVVDDD